MLKDEDTVLTVDLDSEKTGYVGSICRLAGNYVIVTIRVGEVEIVWRMSWAEYCGMAQATRVIEEQVAKNYMWEVSPTWCLVMPGGKE